MKQRPLRRDRPGGVLVDTSGCLWGLGYGSGRFLVVFEVLDTGILSVGVLIGTGHPLGVLVDPGDDGVNPLGVTGLLGQSWHNLPLLSTDGHLLLANGCLLLANGRLLLANGHL